MQAELGQTEFFMTVGDLAFSVYGAMWAYQSDYFYWHFGMYLGRALADTYIVIDWVLNYTELQPYWNLAFQTYKEGQDAWKEMQEEAMNDAGEEETFDDAEAEAENGDDPSGESVSEME